MLYHRTILETHTAYPIPAGTNYIVLTVQKTDFATSTYPIHVPVEKRPLEEKSLPFSKKRSKVRITPVLRRVSRRSQLPMAPVQIPQVPQPPVQIPQVPPTTCADSRCPRTCADSTCPTITCADSRCPRTCADSRCPRTCADSRCPRTCADSRCPRTCADSTCPKPVQIQMS
ncbi:hypothetical protein TNCV_455401 [Trichonephila clavipes]|nr:hypothetical protein TNCV_455401 [Trichonephila clavipes]